MLSVKAVDIKGKRLDLGSPLSVTLCCEQEVPADSLELSLGERGLAELKTVELYRDGELVFSGEVDEQIEEISKFPHTELVARSSGARLIDNEAYPMSLENPCAEDVFNLFAKPFGFRELSGENKEYGGRYTVAKGTSCFGVINDFARKVYGSFPKCQGDVLCIDGIQQSGKLVFGKDFIPFESLRVSKLRCNLVSDVYVKLSDSEGYINHVANTKAHAEGISRVRYLNASSGSSKSFADADRLFAEGDSKSFYAEVVCRGFFGDALGKTAEVQGIEEELYVSSLRYRLSKNAEYTRLTLKRKEK